MEVIALSDTRRSWERVSHRLLTAQTNKTLMWHLVCHYAPRTQSIEEIPKVFAISEGINIFYTWTNVYVIPSDPGPVHPIYPSTDIVLRRPDLVSLNLLTGGTPYP